MGLFVEQAARTPAKVAIRCGNRTSTYAELNQSSDALAAQLRSLGAKPGALVGLFVERSADMVVGLFGILKSGAAYVPMDPAFPTERLVAMIEDAAMPILLTQSSLASTPWRRRIREGRADRPMPRSRPAATVRQRTTERTVRWRGGGGRRSRVRHLHLRLHRPPQRCARSPIAPS